MMAGVLALLLKWWALGLVAIIGAWCAAWCACKVAGKLRHIRKAILPVAVLATLYGGSKTFNLLPRFTADDGLRVVSAEMNLATNEVEDTTLYLVWTGPDATAPIWVRGASSEPWTELLNADPWWAYDPREYNSGTNTAGWVIQRGVAASNATVWAQWHLGSDLPPVEIDGDGVAIEQYDATSKNVTIRYAVNPSALGAGGGVVSIEKQGDDNIWVEMYRLSIAQPVTNTVTFPGFWVGENTRWRVRLEVGQ